MVLGHFLEGFALVRAFNLPVIVPNLGGEGVGLVPSLKLRGPDLPPCKEPSERRVLLCILCMYAWSYYVYIYIKIFFCCSLKQHFKTAIETQIVYQRVWFPFVFRVPFSSRGVQLEGAEKIEEAESLASGPILSRVLSLFPWLLVG